MDYNDKTITMKDGKEYLVIEQVKNAGHDYLFIVNDEDENDALYVEIKDNDILTIDPTLFKDVILPLFEEKLAK